MSSLIDMGNPKGVKRDFAQLEKRRFQAAKLFDRGLGPAEVARRLQVSCQSALRWQQAWTEKGKPGLRQAGRAGRKPKLAPADLSRVEQALKEGPQQHGFATSLWTTQRVAKVIHQLCAVSYHPDHVCRLLQKMGWSCQRPASRARERNEAAIARWKKVTWPAIKKKPVNKGAP
jgi:transposase